MLVVFSSLWTRANGSGIVGKYTRESLLHMKKYYLMRAEGLSVWTMWLTTNNVPGILYSHRGTPSNLIIYDEYVISFEQVGVGKRLYINDIWSLCGASLFKLRNQRPPMCYTSNVVKRGGGGGICRFGADTHWKSWSAPTESCWQMERSTTLWSTPALATHCVCTDNVYHSVLLLTATFFFFLLSLLAGRIKFNCIVYDRYGLRFGTNSRQTLHSHFMVSFHLTCWCVVVTHLTKNIQDGGCMEGCVCVSIGIDWKWTETKLWQTAIFNFQSPLTTPSFLPSRASFKWHSSMSMICWI